MIFVDKREHPVYAKVWEVKQYEKYADLTISTCRKDQEGNRYYSKWYPRVIGHAFNALKDVKQEDDIQITLFELTNEPYTNNNGDTKAYFKMLIKEAEIRTSANTKPAETTQSENKKTEPEQKGTEDWPF